jgi:ABC-type transport system involved in multi-copper enzyme maturation permease subunit
MIVLPIASRELLVASRRRVTYWARVAAALLAGGLALWVVVVYNSMLTPAQVGTRVFEILSRVLFFACLLAGVFLTADSLSGEKREGTLGLLFLTDLKGYDVVLGKLLATSLNTLYGLVAIWPVLALPLVMGGVTPGQFWRMMAALVNALFISLSAGMCLSAVSRREQPAMIATAGVLAVLTFLLPLAGPVIKLASPLTAFDMALKGVGGGTVYVAALAGTHLVGWTLLALASFLVPHFWQETGKSETRPAASKARSPSEAALSPSLGRGRELELNAVAWLANRRSDNFWMWTSLAVVFLVSLMPFAGGPRAKIRPDWAIGTMIALQFTVKFWIAWEAARRLHEGRRLGTLELLAGTPLSVAELVMGQIVSLKRQFIKPILVVLALDAALSLISLPGVLRLGWGADFVMFLLAVVLMFLIDVYALAWVGLWMGLKSKTSWAAALITLAWVLALPTGMCFLVMVFSGLGAKAGFVPVPMIWLVISAVNAALFYRDARDQLHARFRELAMMPLSSTPAVLPPLPAEQVEFYALVK